jgi:hypothetical protein
VPDADAGTELVQTTAAAAGDLAELEDRADQLAH